jgi:phosphoribosylformylglycinamidine cyclo-ligase
MLELARKVPVRAFAHITGGGLPGNVNRVLPGDCDAVVRRGTWDEPRVFSVIQEAGGVPDDEMAAVFNLGLGMIAVVAPDAGQAAVDTIRAAGHDGWIVGEVVDGHGRVHVAPTP